MNQPIFSKQQMADISKKGGNNAVVLAAVFKREIKKTEKALKSANQRFFKKLTDKKEKKINAVFCKICVFFRININGHLTKEEISLARTKTWNYLEILRERKDDFAADPEAYLFCVYCGDNIFERLKKAPAIRKCATCTQRTNNGNG